MATVNETFVRELDSFEEFFWQLEQVAPVCNIAGALVSGDADLSVWEDAWTKLHLAHPALSFSIRKEDGQRPYFVYTGIRSPVRHSNTPDQSLTAHMERDVQESFGSGDGALARLHLVPLGQSTSVVLILHHALMDGVSLLVLLQDLLALMNGEEVHPSSLPWPSLRTIVGLPERPGYRTKNQQAHPPGDAVAAAPPALRVVHLDLSPEESSALLQTARDQQTSAQGALLAAVALTGAATNPNWRVAPVGSNTAHNARPKHDRDSLGMITTAIVTKIDVSAGREFWDIARSARSDTLPGQTEEGHRRFIEVMDELTADERSPLEFVMTLPESPISYELMVSNFAGYSPRTQFGPLRLTSLFTTVNGGPDMGTIGVCTLEGRLGMTLVTRQPASGLLDGLKNSLVAASRTP